MLAEKLTSDKPKHGSEVASSVKTVEISFDFIEWRDLSTFVRCEIDGDQVDNLKVAYEAGECVPPVDLFAEKTQSEDTKGEESRVRYYISDGWHRVHALRELGRAVIPAVVHTGGRREALKFALGANAMHGLRRTNKDKRNAVEVALREFPSLSNRAIAELCKVSHMMVNEARKQVEDYSTCDHATRDLSHNDQHGNGVQNSLASPSQARTGLDGKRYSAKVHSSIQLDFFELVGREWAPVVKSFDLTIKSIAWLDDRVAPEKKLEALSAMRQQLDGMRVQLAERERAIKTGIGVHEGSTNVTLPASDNVNVPEGVIA